MNFNGSTINSPDTPFHGFNDWNSVDFLQIGARENALGFSGGTGAGAKPQAIGGGTFAQAIGGGAQSQAIGGGAHAQAIGGGAQSQAIGGGALAQAVGGGAEQDEDQANASADAPAGLTAVQSSHTVVLNWSAPGFGQTRKYTIWRATGSFPTLTSVLANIAQFKNIGTVAKPTPPATTFTDPSVKNNSTYTYFVTAALGADSGRNNGNQSGPSNMVSVAVKF